MNSNDLKIFLAAAELGSFTKAADDTFTVQSNVTARIKSLEEEFGAELFKRSGRRVVLTDAGRTLVSYARKIGHLIENAKDDIQKGDNVGGILRIGCIETTMALKAPEIIKDFGLSYPEVELEFHSSDVSTLIRKVLDHKLDAAYVAAPIHIAGLKQLKICDEELVVIAPEKNETITEMLRSDDLKIIVFEEGCFFRSRLEAWLTFKSISQYKLTVVNSIEGIVNFVEAGLGISIMPAEVIRRYYQSRRLQTLSLNKELGTMTTLLVYRDDIDVKNSLKAYISQSFTLS